MECVQLALTEKRKIRGMDAIFPTEYYDIPGLKSFGDVDAVGCHAFSQMSRYKHSSVDLYVNGGMTVETLAAVQAAGRLEIALRLFQWDREQGQYRPQQVRWRPIGVGHERTEGVCLFNARHAGALEPGIFDPLPKERLFDFEWQEAWARQMLKDRRGKRLSLYLSGYTPAGISVLNAAFDLKISVTAMHYDNVSECYFPQDMEVWED